MRKVVTKEEAINLITGFWGSKLEGNKNLNNGDPNTFMLASVLDSVSSKATTQQIILFKNKLKEKIEVKLASGSLEIYCDYHADDLLGDIAVECGIDVSMTTFGFKTGTSVWNNKLYLNGEEYEIKN
ncbi:hypothetical protein [Bacillus thuringiensis]|uniref:hypothetical protein n=1 Tax=Bacillus thuringiensis TaxID=1428 RepID=UPI0021D66AE6|nr:hypothetical protein [Bacillus thuringiensis]MCU7667332.1 hypothetical protein [Bacillus thuringiensis]